MSEPSGERSPGAAAGDCDPRGEGSGDELLRLVYKQLRGIAQQRMREQRGDHTLQATALVHEAYARLAARGIRWNSEAHFMFAASRAMRDVLVEHARARARVKRGGDGHSDSAKRAPHNVADLAAIDEDGREILALDEALGRLEAEEPDVAAVVRLRFFAGLTGDQTAEALGLSPRQVDRLWAYARARLFRYVQERKE